MESKLIEHCNEICELFSNLIIVNSRTEKEYLVNKFRKNYPELNEDLDFCFEVLAGKHKLGYTLVYNSDIGSKVKLEDNPYLNRTIKELFDVLKKIPKSDANVLVVSKVVPFECSLFIEELANRELKLGYSNKQAMITHYSPMLAKKYQDMCMEGTYFIQEKLDGNRCIAAYNYDLKKWEFWSRSGKQLKVDFDMSWVTTPHFVFDGEIMTLAHAGTRDFNRTSGAINGKYTDKSKLHYYIYDIIIENTPYRDRKKMLDLYEKNGTGNDCSILPVLDEITIYRNHDYNWKLDELLDFIVDKGGEGVMLRNPCGYYECGKRSNNLLKYKKTQTMDLRIVDWNYGTPGGKYENAIGSFVCQSDDGSIVVNVSGMPDNIHYSDPSQWMGKIIEVAYFDKSLGKDKNTYSLRFPRLKKVRDDKDTTSVY